MHGTALSLLVALAALFVFPASHVKSHRDDPAPNSTPILSYPKDIIPILKAYCFECHNPSKRRGGLDLLQIDSEKAAIELPDLWKDVGEKIHVKDMPPPKSKQPSESERAILQKWVVQVTQSQVDYSAFTKEQRLKALALPSTNRRLNRDEYNNTIRDLFGFDFQVGEMLPSEGGGGEGFDNAGVTLFITPVLIEKYLETATLVLDAIIPTGKVVEKKIDERNVAKLAEVRKKLFVTKSDPDVKPHEAAKKILESFLPRAFRRPATTEDIERYLEIFDKANLRGDSYELSLKLALKSVLLSPNFLFLIESISEKKDTYTLTDFEIASRLSYFLWSSMPDETLWALASKNLLHEEKVLREQVRRMLRDSKIRGFAENFGAQWLGIRPLGRTVRPDALKFPEFDQELSSAMREETILFLDAIVREDRSMMDVIHTDFTFVNEKLAAHYGIPGIKGPEMRRIKLNDPNRGGILGHASILTVTSFPHRTSPVLRGRWILEELLGTDIPPPPPDAPVLDENQKSDKKLTFRQMLEKHRTKAECANCHNRMDPLGFGLENFDAIGRWRAELGGQPVDSTGVMPTGEIFHGPMELKQLLLNKRKPDFLRNVSRKMLGFALGREVRNVDRLVVQDCVKAMEGGEYRVSTLIETIVTSIPFTRRNPVP